MQTYRRVLGCITLLGWLLGWLLVSVHAQANSVDTQKNIRVMVLGDAFSADALVPVAKRWTSVLKQELLASGMHADIVNISQVNMTAYKAKDTLRWQLRQHRPHVVLVQLGNRDGQEGFTVNFIQENLLEIISIVKSSGALPVLIGVDLPPALMREHAQTLPSLMAGLAKRQNVHYVQVDMSQVNRTIQLTSRDVKYLVNVAQEYFVAEIAPAIQTIAGEKAMSAMGEALTPVGAIRVANATGTIPAWTGGYPSAGALPRNYIEGGYYVDPYAEDQPEVHINADNLSEYAEHLTAGQVALLQRYDSMALPVYPTRRSAAYPLAIYDATANNAHKVKLHGNDQLQGYARGFPFPVPKDGAEAIWNHKVRYRGEGLRRFNNQVVVNETGKYTMVPIREDIMFAYGALQTMGNEEVKSSADVLLFFRQYIGSESVNQSPQHALLVHESLDQTRVLRRAWQFKPESGASRWALSYARNLNYDHPGMASQGLRYADQVDMFNGALDRYDWELKGQKEIYIPYNSYNLNAEQVGYADVLKPGHINMQHTRYELHRVWVVEATLKADEKHQLARRVFYLDEDSWTIAAVDNYDAEGQLQRYQEAHLMNYYDVPMTAPAIEVVHDLSSDRYFVSGLSSEHGPQLHIENFVADEFMPKGMQDMLLAHWPDENTQRQQSYARH